MNKYFKVSIHEGVVTDDGHTLGNGHAYPALPSAFEFHEPAIHGYRMEIKGAVKAWYMLIDMINAQGAEDP